MSKQRAHRRAEREAAAAAATRAAESRRVAAVARRRRRGVVAARLRRALGRPAMTVDSAQRRARARRWAPIAAAVLIVNVVSWVLWPSWTAHVLTAVVSIAALPLVGIWVTDAARRGPGRYGPRL